MADQIMAESKPRKPGLLRRILWGLWVIFLTALLVFGFVFAAPWKVITLIAIFLAAATVLPRIYRKWFWLGVGLVVLAIIAWIFLPDDNKGWQPYQFDKELAQLQARYAVPDSENAAIVYNQILADWKQKEPNEPNLSRDEVDFVRRNFWLTKDQPEAATYIKYYRDTLDQLVKVSIFEKCSFSIADNPFKMSDQLELTGAIRRWAHLLVIAGNNNVAEGNSNEGIEKYLALLRISQQLCQQLTPINKMVGIALEALAMGRINDFVISKDANEFYLGKLEQAVSAIKHDWNSDLTGFIDYDKLEAKNIWGVMCYQVNVQSKIRFSRDPSEIFKEHARKQLAKGNTAEAKLAMLQLNSYGYWWKKFMKAYTIPYWFYMPETPEKLGKIIDVSYEKHYAMTKPDFDWPKEPESPPEFHFTINIKKLVELMVNINKSTYPGLHNIYLRIATQQRGAQLIIALKRYKNANGHWPDSLDDVKTLVSAETFIDPMNNSSFVYKRTDDGFTLYGKGKNGIDENGKYENNWPAKPGADDLLIWPFKSKVSPQQEQKTEN
jgi:hypothetical protein